MGSARQTGCPSWLDDDRARLAVRNNKVLQCRHLGTRVGWVRNRAKGDLHALWPQIDADIATLATIEKTHMWIVGKPRHEPIVRRPG